MVEYKKLFGIDFNISEMKVDDLPVYLTARRFFFRVSYSGNDFLLVKVSEKEEFGVLAIEKQARILSEKYDMPVAFDFENITRSQRDSLIEKNIPFVSESGQLYLPFLGMMLRNQFVHPKMVKKERMMPATQALFLHLLYNGKGNPISKKDAAQALGVTRTSITRASDQLDAMGLIVQETCGKESHMSAKGEGLKLFEKAIPYLINPVQRTIMIKSNKHFESCPLSGEAALAKRTMLNVPKIMARAVYKAHVSLEDIHEIDIRWNPDEDVIYMELWKYNPDLYAKNGSVDPISLFMSFENNVDERIEGALEEYLEDYEW